MESMENKKAHEDKEGVYDATFSVFTAIDDIIAFRKLKGENSVFKRKIAYLDQQLKGMLVHNDNRVLDLIRRKDYLRDSVCTVSDTLVSSRKEADNILIERHVIEVVSRRVARDQDLDLPEIANWLAAHKKSNDNGIPYNTNLPLILQLPDLNEVVDRQHMQKKVLKELKGISVYTGKMIDQLIYHSLKLFNILRDDATPMIRRFPVFREPSREKMEHFDYYGYSPAGPIVPPLDISWCSANDEIEALRLQKMQKQRKDKFAKPPPNLPSIYRKPGKIIIAFGKKTIVQ